MAIQIELQSTNYNGQLADITYYPCSGGTISLGYQTIPYTYTNDNYEGTYDLFFSGFNQTCQLVITCPTPTPTVTPTNTATPTPTITPTLTPTPTSSPAALLLFDVYNNGRLGYSLRKLKTSYVGNCIEVRRSSDNATQNIGFSGNVLDSASLLAFVGGSNGFVKTWYDQSGNAENAVQATNANQPIIVSGGTIITSNSLPSLRLVGSNTSYLDTTTNIPQPDSVFLVSHNLSSVGGQHFYDGTSRQLVGSLGGPNVIMYAGAAVITDGAIPNNLALYSSIFDGASSSLEVNNGAITTGNPGTAGIGATLHVGSGDPPIPNVTLNGFYSEFVVFTGNKTTDKAGIKSDIMTYYSL